MQIGDPTMCVLAEVMSVTSPWHATQIMDSTMCVARKQTFDANRFRHFRRFLIIIRRK